MHFYYLREFVSCACAFYIIPMRVLFHHYRLLSQPPSITPLFAMLYSLTKYPEKSVENPNWARLITSSSTFFFAHHLNILTLTLNALLSYKVSGKVNGKSKLDKAAGGEAARKSQSHLAKAGLQFPIGRIHRLLKKGNYAQRVRAGMIYLLLIFA
jgi:hypothetical protein